MSKQITLHDGDEEIYLDASVAYSNGQPAIKAFTMQNEPWASVTTCISYANLSKDETIIDNNEFPFMLRYLVKMGLVIDTGKIIHSGNCTHPIVKVTEKLKAS